MSKETIKNKFKNGMIPDENDFGELIDFADRNVSETEMVELKNTITKINDNLSIQGKAIQDLVAEGQLTEEQYANLISAVNGLVKSGHITIADIDRNKFKIDETMVAESLLEQIAGTADIHSVPARESVDRSKIARRGIALDNLNFVKTSNNIFNKKNVLRGYTINTSTGGVVENPSTWISEPIYVHPETSYVWKDAMRIHVYDESLNLIQNMSTSPYTTPKNAYFIRLVGSGTSFESAQLNIGSTLSTYDEYKVRFDKDSGLAIDKDILDLKEAIGNKELKEKAVTYDKTDFIGVISDNLIDISALIKNKSILNGQILDNEFHDITDFVNIKPNQSYVFNDVRRWTLYDINKIRIADGESPQMSTPSNAHYVRLTIAKTRTISAQMNEGDVLKPHDRYRLGLASEIEIPVPERATRQALDTRLKPFRGPVRHIKKDYQDIVDALPDTGCEVEVIGQDSAGYDIYALKYGDTANKPVVFLNGNAHGIEWLSLHYVVDFMTRIATDNFYDKEIIKSLKNDMSFYAIVSSNPWGYINGKYDNANGVNINRNYDHRWENFPIGEGTIQYKGPQPFSEIENQIIRDKILELKPILAIDCHASDKAGGFDTNPAGISPYTDILKSTYNEVFNIYNDANLWIQEWNLGGSPTFVGWVKEQSNKYGEKIIATTVEQPMTYNPNGDYALTSLFALTIMAHENLN